LGFSQKTIAGNIVLLTLKSSALNFKLQELRNLGFELEKILENPNIVTLNINSIKSKIKYYLVKDFKLLSHSYPFI